MRALCLLVLLGCKKEKPVEKPVVPPPAPKVVDACFGVEVAANEVACKIATECAPVLGVCGSCYQGVNLEHAEAVAARVQKRNAAASCKHGTPPKAKIDCKERRCTVIGYDTAPPKDCVQQAAEIRQRINSSRECKTDGDCNLFNYGCPFGCTTPINKQRDLIPLSGAVSRYRKACPPCKQKCPAGTFEPYCDKGLCAARVRAE